MNPMRSRRSPQHGTIAERAEVVTVDDHLPAVGLIEANDHVQQGRLTGTRPTDQRHHLSRVQ